MTKDLTSDQRELIDLSNAYLRLREILGAWNTPTAPTAEQVWKTTEDAASKIVTERQEMINFIRDIGNFANGEGDAGNVIARRCRAMLVKVEGESE